jgi:hypothetical protein
VLIAFLEPILVTDKYGNPQVTWLQGSAHNPSTFENALADADGVVHTLGTLIEDGGAYKQALREGNVVKVLGTVCDSMLSGKNPLMKGGEGSYESINRDSGAYLHLLWRLETLIRACIASYSAPCM